MGFGVGRGDLSPELCSGLVVTLDDSCPLCKMGLLGCVAWVSQQNRAPCKRGTEDRQKVREIPLRREMQLLFPTCF